MIYFQVTASYLLRDIIIVTTSSTLTNPFILISGDRQEDMKVNLVTHNPLEKLRVITICRQLGLRLSLE